MKNIGKFTVLLLISTSLNAQQDDTAKLKLKIDSIKSARIDEFSLLYPRIRQFTITHQKNAISNIESTLYGNEFFKGHFRSERTAINFNLPIVDHPKNILVANLGVVHQFFYLSQINPKEPQDTISTSYMYIPMINLGINYTRRDSIFGKPVTFTAGLNALFDPPMKSYQFTFLGLITLPVIQRPYTRLVLGVAANIDPSSAAPVMPIISFYNKFKSVNVDLMADLPYRIAIRKPIKKTSLTLFTEMTNNNSFFRFTNPSPKVPDRITYSLLELKSGVLIEYRATRKLVFSLSGGMASTLKSKILKQGARPNDYLINNKIAPTPYIQIGLSLLPFWSPFKNSKNNK